VNDHLWANNPTAVLYTVDRHGMAMLFSGPAYLHGVSGRFVPIGSQPEPITVGLTGQTPEGGVKVPCPAMSPEEQEKLLAACVPPPARNPGSITGNEGYNEAARLGREAEQRVVGFGSLPK
jgi:hypothetical protein